MALASIRQLADLHSTLRSATVRYAKDIGTTSWGWPGGHAELPTTYMIPTPKGLLLMGPDDEMDNRWWLPVALQDDLPVGTIKIDYEFNIPKIDSARTTLAFEYESLGPRVIAARHKGWVTVGRRVAAETFFRYYDESPGPWPVIPTDRGPRLGLFTFDLDHLTYLQFRAFASAMAEFADYMTLYKDSIREELA